MEYSSTTPIAITVILVLVAALVRLALADHGRR